jgi:hypothetical protein
MYFVATHFDVMHYRKVGVQEAMNNVIIIHEHLMFFNLNLDKKSVCSFGYLIFITESFTW